MATLILLLAMLAFVVWAIAHTHRRINWHQDDNDAEAFLAQLRAAERNPSTVRVEVESADGEWITISDSVPTFADLGLTEDQFRAMSTRYFGVPS